MNLNNLNPKFRLNLSLSQIQEIQSKFDPDHEIYKYISLFLFKQQLNNNQGSYAVKADAKPSGLDVNDDLIKELEEKMKQANKEINIDANNL